MSAGAGDLSGDAALGATPPNHPGYSLLSPKLTPRLPPVYQERRERGKPSGRAFISLLEKSLLSGVFAVRRGKAFIPGIRPPD